MSKIIVSETQQPIVKSFYQPDHFERALDPWHPDAFPGEFKLISGLSTGVRKSGWMAVDWVGNPLGFYPDGMEIET